MRLRLALPVLTALSVAACASVSHQGEPACFHRDQAIETEIGYCQALRVGNTLHISGVVGSGPMPDAVRRSYLELQKVLEAHGLTFADVVRETVYTTRLDDFIQSKGIRKEFYGQSLPAATWVQVERLYLPAFVVEIELTAQFPE